MKKLLYIFILLLSLTACKTKYIEVPKIHTEYIVKNLTRHDTLRTIDSVLIREKGDTVFVDKIRYRDRKSVVNRTDTIIKTDTIQVEVEKKLSAKQKAYMRPLKNNEIEGRVVLGVKSAKKKGWVEE